MYARQQAALAELSQSALGDQAALAIENAQLATAAQGKAVLEVRQCLARDLHDSVTQALYSITLHAEAATRLLLSGDVATAGHYLRELQDAAQEALEELRFWRAVDPAERTGSRDTGAGRGNALSGSIRVLVVDDHVVARKGIRALLATEPDIEVVGEARDGQEAVAEAARLRPDVILMDLVMPEMDGIEVVQRILASQPEARILVLTSFDADDKVFPAIRAGVLGYILKNSGPAELVRAIRRIHRGESSFHPAIVRKVLHELAHPSERPPASEPLTGREVEVLRWVAHGEDNQQIAAALGISEATVRKHLSNILSKLHLASRTQAALYALREGLASLKDGDEEA